MRPRREKRQHRDTAEADFEFIIERLKQIEEQHEEQRKQFEEEMLERHYTYYEHQIPAVVLPPARAATAAEVREAIDEAKYLKNVEELAGMILPVWAGRGGKTALNPSIASLPKEAWYLLWEYAVCKRTHKPRGPGRPTESREKKLGNTGTHRAVRLALDIEDILPGKYPNEQTEWIRERAIELASIISEVPGTRIANYLERPRGDRRRLW